MPVPKKRHSNTRTRTRRATWKLFPVNTGICPQCGAPVLPHQACKACGTYKGRQVIKIKQKKEKKSEQPTAEKETKKEEKGKKEEKSKKEEKDKKKDKKGKKEKK